MAKGQVTTDDLASGIKSFGGLSSLGGARPVRDNPFRDTRTEPAPPAVVVPPVTAPAPEPAAGQAAETPRLEVINGHDAAGEGTKALPPVKPARERKPSPPRPTPAPAPSPAAAAGREKKLELYPEQVTVMLNADLRDRAEALAKELQRRRTEKTERITTNTVIRVALRAMLDAFRLPESAAVNSEVELYEAVLKQWARK